MEGWKEEVEQAWNGIVERLIRSLKEQYVHRHRDETLAIHQKRYWALGWLLPYRAF